MDSSYFQSSRASGQGTPQPYLYGQTSNSSNSGLYFQPTVATQHYPQSSSYAMQPSVSQAIPGQSNAISGSNRRRDAQMVFRPNLISQENNDLGLRMVVEAKYVGAIIGQQGNNIREITRESKAKCVVDVQKGMRDKDGNVEKVINILGLPDNCSKACVKILEVIEREKEKEERDDDKPNEVELKLRAHNALVGRLIGKQGSTIKKIMADTETTIYVSNDSASMMIPPAMSEVLMSMERTITVRAPTIAAVSAAESRISTKLRHSHEVDLNNRLAYLNAGIVPQMSDYIAMRQMPTNIFDQQTKIAKMYVSNNVVGAIIGSKGAHIRNIMRSSCAHIRIEGGEKKEKEEKGEKKEEEKEEKKKEEDGAHEADKDDDRMIIITGTQQQIQRAQCHIFQKIAEQNNTYIDEVKLKTEMSVPSRLVGRIIGKGGQNVRELQRITGAQVKIAEEHEQAEDGEEAPVDEETTVRIFGNLLASQQVQMRISQLVADFARMNTSSTEKTTATTNGAHE